MCVGWLMCTKTHTDRKLDELNTVCLLNKQTHIQASPKRADVRQGQAAWKRERKRDSKRDRENKARHIEKEGKRERAREREQETKRETERSKRN